MTRPITPEEAAEGKAKSLPPEVIEAFNELIQKAFDGRSATVMQKDAAALIASKLGFENTAPVYKNHLLDIELCYENSGWKVEYDKPGYNESYEASFKFTARTKGRIAFP